MTRAELVMRGEESIADASFLRRSLITLAYRHERWNIVVFECFRVVELLVKGIVCLNGLAPRQSHSIEHVVDDLITSLGRQHLAAPLFVSLETRAKNRYGIDLTGRTLSVFKEIAGIWTQLGHVTHRLPADQLVRVTLSMQNFTITASVDGKTLIRCTDSSLVPPFHQRRGFVRIPRAASIAVLKALSKSLLTTREQAFFSTSRFTRRDARRAIAKMNLALGATKSFYVQRR
jgi:hypothetical protein